MLRNGSLPASVYNTLPNIRDRFNVPEANAGDIEDLKELLNKHNLSDRVRIKLVHTHFHLKDGEVFTAQDVQVPNIGIVNIMQPLPATSHNLFGHHYFVDDEGNLSAYEYMENPGPDLTGHEIFVREFCQIVQNRGLQRTLGLSLRHADDRDSTFELEYPAKRLCIDVPSEVALPYNEYSSDTMTEFLREWPTECPSPLGGGGDPEPITRACRHHKHHKHGGKGKTVGDDDEHISGLTVSHGPPREIDLAGTKLEPSSDLFRLVSYITDHV